MNNKKTSIPKKFLIPYIILSITIVILAVNFILKYADIATPYTYPPSTLLIAVNGNANESSRSIGAVQAFPSFFRLIISAKV